MTTFLPVSVQKLESQFDKNKTRRRPRQRSSASTSGSVWEFREPRGGAVLRVAAPVWEGFGGGSLVSAEHQLGQPDEGVPLRGRPEQADLPDGFLTVAAGQEGRLLDAVALKQKKHLDSEH